MEKNPPLKKCRRGYLRYKVESYGMLIINENKEKPLILRDVCACGAGIAANYPLTVNDKVTVVLMLPFSNNSVRREAKIVWCKQIDKDFWHGGIDFGAANKIQI